MQMTRRLDKLESALPENRMSVRVLFKREGEAAPVAEPPLRANEQAIVVNFVTAKR